MTLPSQILSTDIPNGFIDSPTLFTKAWSKINSIISALGTTPTWTTPTLAAGFSTLAGFQTISYYKDALGWVHLRGASSNTSGGTKATSTVLFTLPAGLRPTANRSWISDTSGAGSAFVRIDVDSSGNVKLGSGVLNGGFLMVDAILFYGEQ